MLAKIDKRVMAGFITTKMSELESLDALKRQFKAAPQCFELDQLGFAPRCGLASTEQGNVIPRSAGARVDTSDQDRP